MMHIIDVIREQEANDAFLLREELNMKICEELGHRRVAELDPETGELTILDEEHGIQLSAVQVLVLSGILGQYSSLIYRAALQAAEQSQEGGLI